MMFATICCKFLLSKKIRVTVINSTINWNTIVAPPVVSLDVVVRVVNIYSARGCQST